MEFQYSLVVRLHVEEKVLHLYINFGEICLLGAQDSKQISEFYYELLSIKKVFLHVVHYRSAVNLSFQVIYIHS